MPRTIRVIAVGLLLLALASSTLMALPSSSLTNSPPAPKEAGDLIEIVWRWVLDILAPYPESLVVDRPTVESEHGSQLDPDGNH
jgi:hypothetical protein